MVLGEDNPRGDATEPGPVGRLKRAIPSAGCDTCPICECLLSRRYAGPLACGMSLMILRDRVGNSGRRGEEIATRHVKSRNARYGVRGIFTPPLLGVPGP